MYDPANFALENQVAVVTGAGAGIGRAIAETFAAAGAAVMVSDLEADTANAVVKEIAAKGGKAAGMACDVTKEDDLSALVNHTVQKFGKLTILVGNAGGGGPKPFDMPMEDFRRAYELNVFSLFRLYRFYSKSRNFSWVMMRKLSDTLSRNCFHSRGMISRMNARIASANCF